MKIAVLILLAAFGVCAQTFPAPASAWQDAGWITGCVSPGGAVLHKSNCTPTNMKPTGTFDTNPCVEHYDPNTQRPFQTLTTTFAQVAYSTQTSISAKNKYALVGVTGGGTEIYNRATCALVRTGPASQVGYSFWSNYDDEKLFFISGNLLRVYNVTTNTSSTLITFNGAAGRPSFTTITVDGTADLTKDEYLAIHAPTEKYMCVVNLNVTVDPPSYCVDYTASVGSSGTVDYIHTSPGTDSISGVRYLILQGTGAALTSLWTWTTASPTPVFQYIIESGFLGSGNHDGVWVTGENGLGSNTVNQTASPHATMGETSDGRQFYIAQELADSGATPSVGIVLLHHGATAFKLASGGGGLATLYTTASAYEIIHVGCARAAPYCVISGTADIRTYGDTSTAIDVSGGKRLLSILYNAGEKISVVGTTMSQLWAAPNTIESGYLGHAFANLSRDGSILAYQTSLGKMDFLTVATSSWRRDAKNLRITGRTASGGTVRYVAPNVSACTVTISVNANFSSPLVNAVSDSGGFVQRSYNFTTGASGTLYYVRAICGTQNADTSFTTL